MPWASPLYKDNALRGRLVGCESDYLRFTVSGSPQLWRIQVAGDGLERLDAVDVLGTAQQTRQAEGGRRIRLENLYLLPGDHYFRVVGQDGKYTVRAVALGAPVETPLTVAQQAAFTSTTTPTAMITVTRMTTCTTTTSRARGVSGGFSSTCRLWLDLPVPHG